MNIKKLYKLDNKRHDRWALEEWFITSVNVADETCRSWVLDDGWGRKTNVNKKTGLATPDYTGIQEKYYETEEEAKDALWYKENHRLISLKFEQLKDLKTIKQIAKILGVPINEW